MMNRIINLNRFYSNKAKMPLIGLLAKKQHGKDTTADYMIEKYKYKKLSLASPLKEGCRFLFNFNDEQLYGNRKEEVDPFWGVTPRTIFQYLGTDIFRKDINKIIPGIDENFWVNCMKNKYQNFTKENPDGRYVISDVRFQNEVDTVHELGGIVIKIERPDMLSNDSHESETNIDKIKNYDFLLDNGGTMDELYKKIDKLDNIIN